MSKFFLVFCLFSGFLHADWHGEFDRQTFSLIAELPQFQNVEYEKNLSFFIKRRTSLETDPLLEYQMRKIADLRKKIFFKEFPRKDIILKKRERNCIRELYVWEMSYLLDAAEFVVPSFPVEVAGKVAIMQRKEPFIFAEKDKRTPPKRVTDKVPLSGYWRSHLLCYILSIGDLVGRNIGVGPTGTVRLFDTESSFKYYNEPTPNEKSFKVGFLMESFEWPQYRMPLDAKTAEDIYAYIQSLDNLEEALALYAKIRAVDIDEEGLRYRLEKVRSFPLEEGKSFADFYGFLYPKLDQGLDELNRMVSSILGHRVDHGTALFFICQRQFSYDLSSKQKKALKEWQKRYVE